MIRITMIFYCGLLIGCSGPALNTPREGRGRPSPASDPATEATPARMREVERSRQGIKHAPPECVAAFREFFSYLRTSRSEDIVTDAVAQNRWLSRRMRYYFADHIRKSGKPEENPDYPSSYTFFGVWNTPTTFSIVGSRHYDFRDEDNPNDNRAILDVLYEWDHEVSVENQYAGEKCLYSFIFLFEEDRWKLDDIYTFDDKYTQADSLRQYLSTGR